MFQMTRTYLRHTISRFVKNETGATAIEYALIAALISVVAIVAWQFVGNQVSTTMNNVGSAMATS